MRARSTIAVVAAAALFAAPPAHAQQAEQGPRTIAVTGTATRTAANDAASFELGVTVFRRSPNQALREASRRMARVIAAVRRQGVEESDIRTIHVGVRRTVRRRGRHRLTRYAATNRVEVTVRDLARAGPVAAAAVEAGATDVDGPSLSSSHEPRLYREALVAAFEDAREKARALARSAEMTLGRPLSISEGVQELNTGQREAFAAPPAALVQVPVEPGETTVEAVVSVVFEAS